MKSSQWYSNKSRQSLLSNVPKVPVIVRSGSNADSTERKRTKSEEKHFVVGVTLIGGEEVVGG